jgi:hypothetical protein
MMMMVMAVVMAMVVVIMAVVVSEVPPHGDHFLMIVISCLGRGRSEAHLHDSLRCWSCDELRDEEF